MTLIRNPRFNLWLQHPAQTRTCSSCSPVKLLVSHTPERFLWMSPQSTPRSRPSWSHKSCRAPDESASEEESGEVLKKALDHDWPHHFPPHLLILPTLYRILTCPARTSSLYLSVTGSEDTLMECEDLSGWETVSSVSCLRFRMCVIQSSADVRLSGSRCFHLGLKAGLELTHREFYWLTV